MHPRNDGVDHINIYSKGATELGRLLSNFACTPYVIDWLPPGGHKRFASVEAKKWAEQVADYTEKYEIVLRFALKKDTILETGVIDVRFQVVAEEIAKNPGSIKAFALRAVQDVVAQGLPARSDVKLTVLGEA